MGHREAKEKYTWVCSVGVHVSLHTHFIIPLAWPDQVIYHKI